MKLARSARLLSALTIFGALTLVAPPAHADVIITDGCSAGGFTGTIRATVERNGPGAVYRIEYKIDKGSQSGGNHANVLWNDAGTAPTKIASTGNGIQNNSWQTLLEANYFRGAGPTAFRFIFDKSNSGDPRCDEAFPLY